MLVFIWDKGEEEILDLKLLSKREYKNYDVLKTMKKLKQSLTKKTKK